MQNIQLEATVLSCMMNSYERAQENGILEEIDFTDKTHKKILRAIKELVCKKIQPDCTTIYEHLNKNIDFSYLMDISDTAPTVIGFRNYIKQLQDITLKRKLINLANEIKTKELTGKELSEFAEEEIFRLREEIKTSDFDNIKELMADTMTHIEDIYKQKGMTGISTGFKAIDDITDGLQKKNLIYLAARPSMGKTALAMNIATNIAKKEQVAIFSLEMSKEELLKRMVLSEAHIPHKRIKDMKDHEWKKLTTAANVLYNSKIHIYDRNNLKVPEMISMCRKLKKDNGLGLIVIDYLQLMPLKGNRYEGMTNLSIALKGMAKELDCPLIVLSQLNRKLDERKNKRPIMSDLRESGQIEQDADVIMFLYRDEYYDSDTNDKGIAEVIFAKQRNNPTGFIKLGWLEAYTKFINYGFAKGAKHG